MDEINIVFVMDVSLRFCAGDILDNVYKRFYNLDTILAQMHPYSLSLSAKNFVKQIYNPVAANVCEGWGKQGCWIDRAVSRKVFYNSVKEPNVLSIKGVH